MLIEMLETRRLTEDGFAIRLYEKGRHYDLADTAARWAISNGWARDVNPKTNEESFRELMAKWYGEKRHAV